MQPFKLPLNWSVRMKSYFKSIVTTNLFCHLHWPTRVVADEMCVRYSKSLSHNLTIFLLHSIEYFTVFLAMGHSGTSSPYRPYWSCPWVFNGVSSCIHIHTFMPYWVRFYENLKGWLDNLDFAKLGNSLFQWWKTLEPKQILYYKIASYGLAIT